GVHNAELVVLAFPAKGTGLCPRLDDKVMRFFEALAVVERVGVRLDVLDAAATDETGNEPAAGDHVDDGELFGEVDGAIPDGQGIAEEDNLDALREAGKERGEEIDARRHAERRGVVLVEHDAIEADFFDELVFIEALVVEAAAGFGVEVLVRVEEGRDALLTALA